MVIVPPAIQSSSRSRRSNAAIGSRHADGEVVPRKPMTGTFCCARGERPCGGRAAEKANELTSPHIRTQA